MGVRETLSKSKPLGIGIASVMIIAGVAAIFVQAGGMDSPGLGDAYFTVDDGKTFFEGDARQRAPFDSDGKQAVRAHVFECGGKRVVGYMSRYTQDALATIEEAKQARAAGRPPANIGKLSAVSSTGVEYKKPGTDKWVGGGDTAALNAIRIFKCPDGATPPELFPD